MSGIIKPVSRETIEFNQQYLERWGKTLCDGNFRAVLLIGVDPDKQILFQALDDLTIEQVCELLEMQARMLRTKIKTSS